MVTRILQAVVSQDREQKLCNFDLMSIFCLCLFLIKVKLSDLFVLFVASAAVCCYHGDSASCQSMRSIFQSAEFI